MKSATARHKGQRFEHLARRWLEARGLTALEQNYLCRLGELDLVMQDRDSLVFVEVKYRRPQALVSGPESLTPAKRRRLTRAALHYLQSHPRMQDRPARFDLLAITDSVTGREVNWIRDAFPAEL